MKCQKIHKLNYGVSYYDHLKNPRKNFVVLPKDNFGDAEEKNLFVQGSIDPLGRELQRALSSQPSTNPFS
jgi:hypothetical protein